MTNLEEEEATIGPRLEGGGDPLIEVAFANCWWGGEGKTISLEVGRINLHILIKIKSLSCDKLSIRIMSRGSERLLME